MSESGYSFRHVELLNEEIDELKKSIEAFKKELDLEHGYQIQNAQGKSQWHKGCLEGFNHVQRIFSKHLK